mgnify:CR=1 FL=1
MNMKNLWIAVSILSGAIGGYIFWLVIGGVRETELTYFLAAMRHPVTGVWFAVLAGGVLGGVLAFTRRARLAALALLPCWGMLPALWLPDFLKLLLVATMLPLLTYRVLLLFPRQRNSIFPKCFWLAALILFVILFIGQGIYIHWEAWRRQYMFFTDWGYFTEIAWNTWRGDYFRTMWLGNVNFMGDHFEPSFFLLYLPLIGLFPSPMTSVVCGAVLLWGSAVLLYWFARSRELPREIAFIAGAVWLLYPSISNMNLSLFYGFHPDFFFIPFFLLFCWAWEKQYPRWSIFFFIWILLLKETNGASWFGWSICQLLGGERKRRKTVICFGVTGVIWLILCMKWIIPAFRDDAGAYQYMSQFAALGNSIGEIAVSFISRPDVFWSRIFTAKNMIFLWALVLPVFIASFHRFAFILSGGVILVFLFLRGDQEMVNLNMWYQTEASCVLLVGAVLGLERVYRNGAASSVWGRIISAGMLRGKKRQRALQALSYALLLGCALSFYLFAQSFYGCNSYDRIMSKPDCTPVVEQIKQIIPERAYMSADPRCAAHFILRNRVEDLSLGGRGDWLLYDRSELVGPNSAKHIEFLNRPDFRLVRYWFFKGHDYYLFQRGARKDIPSPLRMVTPQQWLEYGTPIPIDNAFFEARGKFERVSGRLLFQCAVRCLKKPPDDYLLTVELFNQSAQHFWRIPFGYGIYPAPGANPGEVFQVALPIPEGWSQVSGANVELIKRR